MLWWSSRLGFSTCVAQRDDVVVARATATVIVIAEICIFASVAHAGCACGGVPRVRWAQMERGKTSEMAVRWSHERPMQLERQEGRWWWWDVVQANGGLCKES